MARYNAWQNTGLRRMVAAMDPAELSADRGAFFGSIMATLNHLLWADQVWLHRLAGHPAPDCGIAQ
ncbi:MAG: damage-inducible protein DinB, partial [Rhodobacterales bacterium]|nr:damage-inducible protein DinB [Rhodobacterales bacterium]